MSDTVYGFSTQALNGGEIKLADYAGKVMLIVNTASECGFTPQYAGLEQLWREYRERGLMVLGFPCNQFGKQEPGSAEQIGAFCEKNYGVTFPLSQKVEVNGESAHPLFKHLTEEARGVLGTKAIKWNFTKFLIDRQGRVVDRYASTTKPEEMISDIERLLAQQT